MSVVGVALHGEADRQTEEGRCPRGRRTRLVFPPEGRRRERGDYFGVGMIERHEEEEKRRRFC